MKLRARALKALVERSPRAEKIAGTIQLIGVALTHTATELAELGHEMDVGTRKFHVVVYLSPITVPERERLIDAYCHVYNTDARHSSDPEDEWLAVAVPRGSACVGVRALATGADGAAALCLTYLRRALVEAKLTVDWLRLEVEADE